MLDLNNVFGIERVNGVWVIKNFTPSRNAHTYDSVAGKTGTLYILECGEFCKIGMTTDFDRRFKNIEAGMPFDVKRVATRSVPLAGLAYAEAWMHKQFWHVRAKNEWFRVTPAEARTAFPKAVRIAEIYARQCREWFQAEEARARTPEGIESARKEFVRIYGVDPDVAREQKLGPWAEAA